MITDLKTLEKLLKLCRKQGVTELTIPGEHGCTLKLGDMPAPRANGATEDDTEEDPNIDPVTGLTQEQLMFLSVQPPRVE